jgi:ABC transporter substrate binding protein
VSAARSVAGVLQQRPDQNCPSVGPLLQATRTVPIVFTLGVDPVGSGFVASLARPGGNLTGVLHYEAGISGKWLAMLKEVAPESGPPICALMSTRSAWRSKACRSVWSTSAARRQPDSARVAVYVFSLSSEWMKRDR